MVAHNTYCSQILMHVARAHEFHSTFFLCTLIGNTTNPAKCGKNYGKCSKTLIRKWGEIPGERGEFPVKYS